MTDETPISSFDGPISLLIGGGYIFPPSAPGLLAKVAQYDIVRLLGTGGMGMVFLARDTLHGNVVAIKLLRAELARQPHFAVRFLAEAQHLERLRHPNIISVIEICARPECPYFVMPYMDGNLAQRISSGEPMTEHYILTQTCQIAAALDYAHKQGIVHRDVKASNVLLAGERRVCLADFGLAYPLLAQTEETIRQTREGTAPYLSPALAAGETEGAAGDIYAFGALLYEMLVGKPPYRDQPRTEVLKEILAGPPIPILEINPRAPERLVRIAQTAMARCADDRYRTMACVLADLDGAAV